jgi:hypothetical protein
MAPKKKGLSPLAWVAIGCVGILLIGAIALGVMFSVGAHWLKGKAAEFQKNPAYASMKLMVQANPDLEIVSSDESAGTITVRDKKKNETITFNAKDFKDGKITVSGKDGTQTIDFSGGDKGGIKVTNDKGESTFQMGGGDVKDLPSWVPAYPGGQTVGGMSASNAEGKTVSFSVKTSDSVDKVLEFYDGQLKAAGLSTEKTNYSSGGTSGGTVTGKSSDGKRTLTVIVSTEGGTTAALVTVEEKK